MEAADTQVFAGTFLLPQGVSPLAWRRGYGQVRRRMQGEKLSQNRESLFVKLLLLEIKNVFAKFDKRLG